MLDDGLTGVMPFVHKEHWKTLLPLFDRKYPMVENGTIVGYAPILSITVDTGGSDQKGDQATEGAKYFWQAARALGVKPNRITLVKGGSNPKAELMPQGKFADKKAKGGVRKASAQLWVPNVHKIKNMIDARLRRTVPGPGYIHLPENLSEMYLDELTAEELKDGKWEKRRARNEMWDLLVYGEAAILKPPFAQSRSDMRWIPRGYAISWPAVGGDPAAGDQVPQPETQAQQPEPAAPVQQDVKTEPAAPATAARRQPPRRQWIKSSGPWLGRR